MKMKMATIIITILLIPGCLNFFGVNGNHPHRTEWAYEITQINLMNDQGYRGKDVLVGIVDTGIDPGHPMLEGVDIVAWRDFINERSDPYDDNGHGSHVAGIIAGRGEVKGSAPDVKLIVAKALDRDGRGDDSTVANAIDWAVQQGAEVLCLSLGGRARFLNLGDQTATACNRAIDQGVFVVAAAGNDGENDDGDVASPATVDKVIAVGAIDSKKEIAPFSSRGDNDGHTPLPYPFDDDRQDPDKKPEVVAPGVEIVSAWRDHKYATVSGTSQATAFVSGILALVLEVHPEYKRVNRDKVNDLKEALMDSAEPCPDQDTPHDDHYGYGLVQAYELSRRM